MDMNPEIISPQEATALFRELTGARLAKAMLAHYAPGTTWAVWKWMTHRRRLVGVNRRRFVNYIKLRIAVNGLGGRLNASDVFQRSDG